MNFSEALEHLKSGKRLARHGWGGNHLLGSPDVIHVYVVLQAGYPQGIPINQNTADATGLPQGTVCSFLPYLMKGTRDGVFVPWVASQTDILADDWIVA